MAKKFNFRLEPVLNFRKFKTEIAKEALHQVTALRIKKQEFIELRKRYLEDLIANFNVKTDLMNFQAKFYHKIAVEEEIIQLEKDKVNLEEIESLKRKELYDVMQQEKIIANLKEKKLQEYNFEINKLESSDLDAVGISQYANLEKEI